MEWNQKVKELEFRMFCDARGWKFASLTRNSKNKSQFIGHCWDDQARDVHILITNQDYYRLLGNKQYERIDYVLKEDKPID